jgi:hypothetical protein
MVFISRSVSGEEHCALALLSQTESGTRMTTKLCIYSQSRWVGLTPALIQSAAVSLNHHAAGQGPGTATSSLKYEQISTITVKNQISMTN